MVTLKEAKKIVAAKHPKLVVSNHATDIGNAWVLHYTPKRPGFPAAVVDKETGDVSWLGGSPLDVYAVVKDGISVEIEE